MQRLLSASLIADKHSADLIVDQGACQQWPSSDPKVSAAAREGGASSVRVAAPEQGAPPPQGASETVDSQGQ
jgi:hypothetical protein